jgi:protein phosphatase
MHANPFVEAVTIMNLVTPRDPASREAPTPQRDSGARRERTTVSEAATLKARGVRLDVAAASARGRHHSVNEDSHSALDRPSPVYVVADGVGGGAMASWTSRELVRRLHAALDRRRVDERTLSNALLDADRDVARDMAQHTAESGAATVALCVAAGHLLSRWLIAWVGDCRIYRVSTAQDEPAVLLTRDDTYANLGETPPLGGSPDDPARMVGNGAVDAPNVASVQLADDEMLVLCSDGLHKHVEPREIQRQLRARAPLARCCGRLVELARLHGTTDDATVLAIHRNAGNAKTEP